MPQGSGSRGITLSRVLQGALSLAVIGVIFLYFLPRIVDYGEVAATIKAMTWIEVLSLLVLAVWNQATYSILEVSARPGLNYWQAMKITLTSTAISNTLPAGGALGVGVQTGMYISYGFSKADITISMMVTGVWNTFVKLAMPIAALSLLAAAGGAGKGLLAAALVGVLVLVLAVCFFGMALRSERGALVVGRLVGRLIGPLLKLFRRPPLKDWGNGVVAFRHKTIDLLRHRWIRITAAALASHITLFIVLLSTLRHVGVSSSEVSWPEALAAFAFVRLISAVPITPGGLGVVELGATAALVAAGGGRAEVVAAVLVFRVLTFVFPIPLGGIAYLFWRKGAAARLLAREGLAGARTG
ncbi:MAG TPA: YbhN family protein [Actinomycetota bacterium]|nr:YbhN family protein [Actinomycetota bacterium]